MKRKQQFRHICRMASGYNSRSQPKLATIHTSDILEKLKQTKGDNWDFFFLLVSTRGIEDRLRRGTPSGQHDTNLEGEDDSDTGGEDDDNDQMDNDDDVNTTGNTPNQHHYLLNMILRLRINHHQHHHHHQNHKHSL